jgi:uncharacterized protein YndB with AHSA1/START domain
MSTPLIIKNNTTINAPSSKVWDALVNPEQTKKYMHGCATVSDWKVGSPLLWNAVWEGKEMTFVKGNIIAIEPEKYLAYTTIHAGHSEDIPANYLTVTYNLEPDNGHTKLSVTQGDYAITANGEQKYNDALSQGGWQSILEEIKKIVEAE